MKTFSFDVYDTCYTRFYAKPTDLFYETAIECFNRFNIDIDFNNIKLFAGLRIKAEKKSRIKRSILGYEETNLDAIYDSLSIPNKWGVKKSEFKKVEIELESNKILPINYTISLINSIRKKHDNVVFISDMYLPENIIKNNLITLGIWKNGDKLYVSSEINKTKHSGGLFSYVLDDLSIEASQLYHFGDNEHADFNVPKKMGIHAKLFDPIHLRTREVMTLKGKTSSYLIRSQIASACRDTRLLLLSGTQQNFSLSVFDELASDLISPFLFTFVLWTINESKRLGYTDLYFVSRDGEILYKIAKILSPLLSGPQCHYMYGSRHAWNITDYISKRFNRLKWLEAAQNGLSLSAILNRLHLNISDIENLKPPLSISTDKLLSKKEIKTIIKWLCSDEIHCYLLPKLKKHKELFHKYMEQIGITKSSSPAIVDIGWNLSGLRILNEELSTKHIGGLFFGSFKPNEIDFNNIQCDYLAYFDSRSKGSKAILRYGPCLLIESLFTMSSHQSLTEYSLSPQIEVIPSLNSEDKHDSGLALHHHHIVLSFVDRAIKGGLHTLNAAKLLDIMHEQLISFIQSPLTHEALSFGNFYANAEQVHNTQNSTPLVRSFDFRNTLWLVAKNKINPQKPYYWIEGSIAISPWYYRWFLKVAMLVNKLIKGK